MQRREEARTSAGQPGVMENHRRPQVWDVAESGSGNVKWVPQSWSMLSTDGGGAASVGRAHEQEGQHGKDEGGERKAACCLSFLALLALRPTDRGAMGNVVNVASAESWGP